MLNRFIGYLRRKGLELNTEKTKMMCFRKAGDKRKEVKIEVNEKKIELVKKFRQYRRNADSG